MANPGHLCHSKHLHSIHTVFCSFGFSFWIMATGCGVFGMIFVLLCVSSLYSRLTINKKNKSIPLDGAVLMYWPYWLMLSALLNQLMINIYLSLFFALHIALEISKNMKIYVQYICICFRALWIHCLHKFQFVRIFVRYHAFHAVFKGMHYETNIKEWECMVIKIDYWCTFTRRIRHFTISPYLFHCPKLPYQWDPYPIQCENKIYKSKAGECFIVQEMKL